jgi:hypothetical protein
MLALAASAAYLLDFPTAEGARPTVARVDRAVTGAGEPSLILVVAGEYESEAAAETAEDGSVFQEAEGFYIDSGSNYDVLGAFVQSSPNTETIECGSRRARELQIDCQNEPFLADQESFVLDSPVRLRYVPAGRGGRRNLEERRAVEACGGVDEQPCDSALLGTVAQTWELQDDARYRVSAFRTRRGAEAFIEALKAVGFDTGTLTVLRVRKLDGPYVGLGQEAAPDGSGPLLRELPDQAERQTQSAGD